MSIIFPKFNLFLIVVCIVNVRVMEKLIWIWRVRQTWCKRRVVSGCCCFGFSFQFALFFPLLVLLKTDKLEIKVNCTWLSCSANAIASSIGSGVTLDDSSSVGLAALGPGCWNKNRFQNFHKYSPGSKFFRFVVDSQRIFLALAEELAEYE